MMSDDASIDTNALELSDEEFAKLDFDSLSAEVDNEEETDSEEEITTEESEEETVGDDEAEGGEDESEDEDAVDEEPDEGSEEDSDESEEESESSEEQPEKAAKGKKDSVEPEDSDEDAPEESAINYQEAYEAIFSPFKANGKEIQAKSTDDVIRLMQMGANYNKKMAGLKPSLKLLKMLENNNLLDETKLSYLIDLDKKDPKAISKLVKDSGVDPLEMDTEAPNDYKPNTYTVDDKSVELDEILDDIKDTKSYNDTLDIVGNKWDVASKRVISSNPSIIKIINEHVEQGIYSQIQQAVDNERMFGRLEGLSDLEAYKQVGDAINAKGGFSNQEETPSQSILTKPKVKAKKPVDPKLKSRKKAASSTTSVSSGKKDTDFNPLSLSDEEFEKMATSKFI